jgi:hypothetical protein
MGRIDEEMLDGEGLSERIPSNNPQPAKCLTKNYSCKPMTALSMARDDLL